MVCPFPADPDENGAGIARMSLESGYSEVGVRPKPGYVPLLNRDWSGILPGEQSLPAHFAVLTNG